MKHIEEMVRDLENHTCMSQFQAEIASKILYAKGYRKQSDVAKEIFEEIESMLICYTFEDNYGEYISTNLADEFDELKKKYTEVEEK